MALQFRAAAGLVAFTLAAVGITGCGLTPVAPPSPEPASSAVADGSSAELPANVTGSPVAKTGFTDYERAAVRIRNVGCGGVSSGSGFAIADNVIVTNRHVIGGAAVIQVSTYDGREIEVSTAGAAVVADLALVWTKNALPATLSLAPANPEVGTSITAVGYPLGGPLTTTRGVVLDYTRDLIGLSPLPMMLNDAPIEHGSSGSPLINDQGLLVGVAYAGDGSGDQYAVPVDILRDVLSSPDKYSNPASCHGAL